MLASFSSLNYLGVLLAFVAAFVLGGVWFPVLLKKPYDQAVGRSTAPHSGTTGLFFAGPAVCSLVVVLATALLLRSLHVTSYGDALEVGLVVGVGFLATTTTTTAINPSMPRPLLYSLVSGSYQVVVGLVVAVLLTAVG